MNGLPRVFASWRFQAEMIAGGLRDRRYKRLSKRLCKIVDELDDIWLNEFGAEYVNELAALDEINKQIALEFDDALKAASKKGELH